jgi:putative nucleotidyltransferase with HDIG domain
LLARSASAERDSINREVTLNGLDHRIRWLHLDAVQRNLDLELAWGRGFTLCMKTRVEGFVAAVCLAALLLSCATFFALPQTSSANVNAALFFAALAIAAEYLTYELPNGALGSTAFIPYSAAILTAGDWTAVASVTLAMGVVQLMQRRAAIKKVFNIGQITLAAAVGTLLYRTLGGVPFVATPESSLAAVVVSHGVSAALMLSGLLLVNNVTVSAAIALSGGSGLSQVLRGSFFATLSYTLISGPLAVSLGWVYVRSGPVWAAALAIPLLGVRQLYRATLELRKNNQELLELMVKAIEARDPYTSGHSRRVSQSATIIARAMGLSIADVERVRIAALLHDVGKIHEDYARILRKPGRLTDAEWELMKTHPARGAELVSTMSHLRDLVAPIRHHHERWDGKGYPDGLVGHAIPLAARIITVADTLDALTSDRPYRTGLGDAEVRQEFIRCRGAQFDPEIMDRVLSALVWPQLVGPGLTVEPSKRLRRVL